MTDFQRYPFFLGGIEEVSNVVVYYTIVEKLYSRETNATTAKLKEALVDLYMSILTFLMKARIFYSKITAGERPGLC